MKHPACKLEGLEARTLQHLLQIVRRIHPFVESSPTSTFDPKLDISDSWTEWLANFWTPALRTHLLDSLAHARSGKFQEWLAMDEALDGSLSESSARRSRASGHFLLKTCGPLPGDRFFEKVLRLHAAGKKPHLAGIHAARCAAFHVADQWVETSFFALELLPVCDSARRQDFFVELLTRTGNNLDAGSLLPAFSRI